MVVLHALSLQDCTNTYMHNFHISTLVVTSYILTICIASVEDLLK